MMQRKACLGLLLGLLALACIAESARVFDATMARQKLKRTVGKKTKKKGGHGSVQKEVDLEHFGHAAFDPGMAHEDDIGAADIGYREAEVLKGGGRAKVLERLKQLFPLIDANKDGVLSVGELQHHLYVSGLAIAHRRAQAEFTEADTNHDGKLTAAEYLTDLEGDSATTVASVAAFTRPLPLNWGAFTDVELAALVLADRNGDKALDAQEFFEYLNPEESRNEEMRLHRLREDVHDHLEQLHILHPDGAHHDEAPAHLDAHHDDHHEGLGQLHPDHEDDHEHHPEGHVDTDAPKKGWFMHDGVLHRADDHDPTQHHDWDLSLDFDDFYKTVWQSLSVFELGEEGHRLESAEHAAAERRFVLLDTNSDEHVSAEELLPVYNELHPSESSFARLEAESMWKDAKVAGDTMTLDQMLQAPEVFYGVIHEDSHTEL